jgi:putative nucleotidyltransferase with HDIG domain
VQQTAGHPTDTASESTGGVSALIAKLIELPAHPGAALRILWVIDDPKASASELARLVEADPSLSARVMRLANSPYYGMSRQVTNALRAVTVLGFDTVRSLAAVAASGLFSEKGKAVPDGFWSHSAAAAAGSSVVARRCGVPASDAFSAGLLHDLGAALLFRVSPGCYEAVQSAAGDDPSARIMLERAEFEVDHAEAGASVLQAWGFPPAMVEVMREHHRLPTEETPTLVRVIRAGEALAVLSGAPHLGEPIPDVFEALHAVGIDRSDAQVLADQVTGEAEALAAFLNWDG